MDSEGVNWAEVGGGSFGALVLLVVVVVLVASRESARERDSRARVSLPGGLHQRPEPTNVPRCQLERGFTVEQQFDHSPSLSINE